MRKSLAALVTGVAVVMIVLAGASTDQARAALVDLGPEGPAGHTKFGRYVADPGERNDVTFTSGYIDTVLRIFVVHDPGATIRVGPGCVSLDPHTARCVADVWGDGTMRIDLGDGDDVLQPTATTPMIVNGGTGDDLLLGGSSFDRIDGGAGIDVIRGNDGSDELRDGDTDVGATPNADHLDGGAGTDLVSYEGRTKPVLVDLADDRPEGAVGERDLLASIEDLRGGSGDDRLAGDRRGNRLFGGRGNNHLVGRGGGDWLFTKAGSVSCGSGADLVRHPTQRVVVGLSCEQISLPAGNNEPFSVRSVPKMTRRGMVFSASVAEEAVITAMSVRAATGRRPVLARGPRGLADEVRSGKFAIRLRWTDAGRRFINSGSLRVVVRILPNTGVVERGAFGWSVVLPMRVR
jgi:hypothetical protein